MRKAKVYVNNIFSGILKETDEGYEFKYDDTYFSSNDALPISLTLPLTNQLYKSNVLFPFFDGLIPEGFLLDETLKVKNINENDRFGILLISSFDSIGNVNIEEF